MIVDRLRLLGLGGSNKVMQGELSRLARRAIGERSRPLLERPIKAGPGALLYPFDAELAALSVMHHRTSARVLWDLGEYGESRLEPLYEAVFRDLSKDTRPYLDGVTRISVQAFGTGPVLAGERQVVGTIKNALLDAARARGQTLVVDAERPEIELCARSSEDDRGRPVLVVSIDLAGRPMHQRGYRTEAGIAPLREDLAALLVMLARHDSRTEAFVDPLAGTGTLPIEAALLGRGAAVWTSGRRPLAASLPVLSGACSAFGRPLFDDTRTQLFAAERDPETYSLLERASYTAGVETQLRAAPCDFREWPASEQPPAGSLVLSNPPYGERLGASTAELGALYRDLGRFCRALRPARMAFLVGEPSDVERGAPGTRALFLRSFGGRPRIEKPLSNGPLRASFFLYDE